VTFVVSDGSDGTPSSRQHVDAASIASRDGGLGEPGLRRSVGCPAEVDVIEVPPDDPDRAFALLRPVMEAAARGARLAVDYTGGTKSMTTALFLAAETVPGATLQMMRGRRNDLLQVADGTEEPYEPPIQLIGAHRRFEIAAAFARRREYGPAHQIYLELSREIGPRTMRLPADLVEWGNRARVGASWFGMLDAWDRFDFKGATAALGQLERVDFLGPTDPSIAPLRQRLSALREGLGKPCFAMVEDLWLNAQRRAAVGRWDDAVARLYRCAEAALQAYLWADYTLETKAVPADRLSPSLRNRRDIADGTSTVSLGLTDTARLLRHLGGRGAAAADAFIDRDSYPERLGWQDKRNHSILAHGFSPLSEQHWRDAEAWFECRKSALWENGLGRKTNDQLPDAFP
jgi:CRISPR-associated protein (TIGR02710 family)